MTVTVPSEKVIAACFAKIRRIKSYRAARREEAIQLLMAKRPCWIAKLFGAHQKSRVEAEKWADDQEARGESCWANLYEDHLSDCTVIIEMAKNCREMTLTASEFLLAGLHNMDQK